MELPGPVVIVLINAAASVARQRPTALESVLPVLLKLANFVGVSVVEGAQRGPCKRERGNEAVGSSKATTKPNRCFDFATAPKKHLDSTLPLHSHSLSRSDPETQPKEARPLSHALPSDSFNTWTPRLLV